MLPGVRHGVLPALEAVDVLAAGLTDHPAPIGSFTLVVHVLSPLLSSLEQTDGTDARRRPLDYRSKAVVLQFFIQDDGLAGVGIFVVCIPCVHVLSPLIKRTL